MNSFRSLNKRESINIWPGFVDAMTALLLVLMFVLSIFMIVQSILRDTISGQNSELLELNIEINTLKDNLIVEKNKLFDLDQIFEKKLFEFNNLEKKLDKEKIRLKELNDQFISRSEELNIANKDLETLNYRLFSLAEQLGNKSGELNILENKYELKKKEFFSMSSKASQQLLVISNLEKDNENLSNRILSFENQVASMLYDKNKLEEKFIGLNNKLDEELSKLEKANIIIANSRKEIDKRIEEARLAAARSEALEAYVNKLKLENDRIMNEKDLVEKNFNEIEKQKILDQAAISSLNDELEFQKEEFNILTLALDNEKKEAIKTLELLASAKAVKKILEEKNLKLIEAQISEKDKSEAREVALLEARSQLIKEQKLSKASLLEVKILKQTTEQLNQRILNLQNVLDKSEESDKENKIQIETLGNRLNAALARIASEQKERAENLEFYKSEFFGELRKVLDNIEGFEVVGDRFLFASEVLFDSGSDIIEEEGKKQIDKFAKVLTSVSIKIPNNINWILRVDGHTDKTPLKSNLEFDDNWELSQARALSVVRYLIKKHNIDPKRLVAAGFGEFQPIDNSNTMTGMALNRRIELKLTEK